MTGTRPPLGVWLECLRCDVREWIKTTEPYQCWCCGQSDMLAPTEEPSEVQNEDDYDDTNIIGYWQYDG
jgi:hypothetical protein